MLNIPSGTATSGEKSHTCYATSPHIYAQVSDQEVLVGAVTSPCDARQSAFVSEPSLVKGQNCRLGSGWFGLIFTLATCIAATFANVAFSRIINDLVLIAGRLNDRLSVLYLQSKLVKNTSITQYIVLPTRDFARLNTKTTGSLLEGDVLERLRLFTQCPARSFEAQYLAALLDHMGIKHIESCTSHQQTSRLRTFLNTYMATKCRTSPA